MEISGLSSLLWPPPSSIVLLAVPAAPCYAAQGDILPDGSQAGEARQWLQRHRAEQELAAAEQAVQQGVKVRPLLLLDLFYCDWDSCRRRALAGRRCYHCLGCYGAQSTPPQCCCRLVLLPLLAAAFCLLQGAAKRLKAAERQLDAVLESALGDGFDDFLDDFDAIQAEEEEMAAAAAPAAAGEAAGLECLCAACSACCAACAACAASCKAPCWQALCSVYVFAAVCFLQQQPLGTPKASPAWISACQTASCAAASRSSR